MLHRGKPASVSSLSAVLVPQTHLSDTAPKLCLPAFHTVCIEAVTRQGLFVVSAASEANTTRVFCFEGWMVGCFSIGGCHCSSGGQYHG